jgi:S-(hydroxymethyl)glutathione dehydrogenase/alcohol dehydrogenase
MARPMLIASLLDPDDGRRAGGSGEPDACVMAFFRSLGEQHDHADLVLAENLGALQDARAAGDAEVGLDDDSHYFSQQRQARVTNYGLNMANAILSASRVNVSAQAVKGLSVQALLFRPGVDGLAPEHLDIDEPASGEVLVRVVAAGVCHSDVHFMEARNAAAARGLYGLHLDHRMQPGMSRRRQEEADAALLVMGHEPSGVVAAVGSGVTRLRPGDRVVGAGSSSCGRCGQCQLGRPHLCLRLPRRASDESPHLRFRGERVTQFANLGAFAELMLVDESSLVVIGDDVPYAAAAILGCCIATGVGAALNTARVSPGSTVAVFGTGGIGLSVIQGARIAGAATIIAVDVSAAKLEMARLFGATDVVLSAPYSDPAAEIRDLTHGEGVAYSFDTTAVPEAAQAAFDCLGLRGTLTCLAGAPVDMRSIVGTERRVQGCFLGSSRLQADLPRYLELYRQGRLKLDEMISHELPPWEFDRGVAQVDAGRAARVVLRFDTLNGRAGPGAEPTASTERSEAV